MTEAKHFHKLSEQTQHEVAELLVGDKYVGNVLKKLDKRVFSNLSEKTQEEIAEVVLNDDYIEKEKQKLFKQSAEGIAADEPVFQFIEEHEKRKWWLEEEELRQKHKAEDATIDIKLMRHNLGIDFDKEKKAAPMGLDVSEWARAGERDVKSDMMQIKNTGTGYTAKFLQDIQQRGQDYLRQSAAEQENQMRQIGNISSHLMQRGRHISEINK